MKAAIITIGDEILIGQIVDTNSAWLSGRLNEAGFTVTRKLTVGDSGAEIGYALSECMKECDVTIMTGGLGPTKDDITKQTLARYFGCGMKRDEATYRRNERVLSARGVDYNDLNKGQAMIPECCEALANDNGTAPGMWCERDGKVLVSLPGVPFEMKALMDGTVIPRLSARFPLRKIIHRTAMTFGLAESVLAATITGWEDALPEWMHLAYLPGPSGIRLRLSAYDIGGRDEEEEITARFVALEKIIPEYVVGYGDETVASAAARLLAQRKVTLAVAESCTGGVLGAAFTAMPGASEYFLGGIVAYSNEVKANVLGVRPETLEKHGAVSRPTVEEMARGARQVCGSDYAIATTGIAGPAGGTPEKPVGSVWIAVATPEKVYSRKFVFGQLREQNMERASATAINLLRVILLDMEEAFINPNVL